MKNPPDPVYMSEWEIELVRLLISRSAAKTYLEVGSASGGSLYAFGTALPAGSTLITVDRRIQTPVLYKQIAATLANTSQTLRGLGYEVVEIIGDSHDKGVVDRVAASIPGGSLDVLFIDGDHSREGATADLENYGSLVRSGGVIIFHDCGLQNWKYHESKRTLKASMNALNELFNEEARSRPRFLMLQEFSGFGFVWV